MCTRTHARTHAHTEIRSRSHGWLVFHPFVSDRRSVELRLHSIGIPSTQYPCETCSWCLASLTLSSSSRHAPLSDLSDSAWELGSSCGVEMQFSNSSCAAGHWPVWCSVFLRAKKSHYVPIPQMLEGSWEEKKLSGSTDALWFWCLPHTKTKQQQKWCYKSGQQANSSDTLWFGCILFIKPARGQLTLVMMMWFWRLMKEK